MIRSIPREAIVETLLNTLEVERHARRALVLEILGELPASRRFARARSSALLLLSRLDRGDMSDADLTRAVAEVRTNLHEASHEASV